MIGGEQANLQPEAAAGDPLGAALHDYFSVPGAPPIDASAAELLHLLANGTRERGWPSKFKVGSHLERIKPGLLDLGIEIASTRPGGRANVLTFQIAKTGAFRGRATDEDPF